MDIGVGLPAGHGDVDAHRSFCDEYLFARRQRFFLYAFFVRSTDPLLKLFAPITPKFLVRPMVPLFVAWFFYIIRFYLMPLLLGYSVLGMLSFPLESELAAAIAKLFGMFVN